jgi:hypothetical protein
VSAASVRLSDRDLHFLAETAAPTVRGKAELKRVLREDADFRKSFIESEEVARSVLDEEENFVRISPVLFFEILLRRAVKDLGARGYTIEKDGGRKVAVFDAKDVLGLLGDEAVLVYLAEMLASFTRIESYTVAFREKAGLWRKIRFNDLDIRSLMAFAGAVDEGQKIAFFKRIADICLFVLGVFPDSVGRGYRRSLPGEIRQPGRKLAPFTSKEYEEHGRRFYRLAAHHSAAEKLGLAPVFRALEENFRKAEKPLNFVAERYLSRRRQTLFS